MGEEINKSANKYLIDLLYRLGLSGAYDEEYWSNIQWRRISGVGVRKKIVARRHWIIAEKFHDCQV